MSDMTGIFSVIFIAVAISAAALVRMLLNDREKPVSPPAPPEIGKLYTYADYVRDLHNKDMSISDILDKCGGVIPAPPPPAPEALKPPELPDAVKSKMAIFEQMVKAAHAQPRPIVPPPAPVLTVKAWQVPCDRCSFFDFGRGPTPPPDRELEYRKLQRQVCKKCGGSGVLYIQDGR